MPAIEIGTGDPVAIDDCFGRLLHTLDDLDVPLARTDEIRVDDLYAPRLRRLPGR